MKHHQPEATLLTSQVQTSLKAIGQGLRRFMHYPNTQGTLDRCLDLCTPAHAYGGDGLLPSPVPSGTHTRSKNKVAIVFHEYKRAIIGYWELCRTDECVGLRAMLQQLCDYVDYGLDAFDLLGEDAGGYYLVRKGAADAGTTEPEPEPEPEVQQAPEVSGSKPPTLGVQGVLGDVPAEEVRPDDRECTGPADDRDE
jgi:hypothetical protein